MEDYIVFFINLCVYYFFDFLDNSLGVSCEISVYKS